MLNTFAIVGEPAEVARKIQSRYATRVERVSPVSYTPDAALLSTLLSEIRKAGASDAEGAAG